MPGICVSASSPIQIRTQPQLGHHTDMLRLYQLLPGPTLYACRTPPLSAMFSPRVANPFTCIRETGWGPAWPLPPLSLGLGMGAGALLCWGHAYMLVVC